VLLGECCSKVSQFQFIVHWHVILLQAQHCFHDFDLFSLAVCMVFHAQQFLLVLEVTTVSHLPVSLSLCSQPFHWSLQITAVIPGVLY